ncbi:MAG: UxaA family hydrolase [Candidatus Bathyarchaeota archaeon]|nr:MAG: UxaA family hydrolase [Candidatus Bathyarchaeota archaeon]
MTFLGYERPDGSVGTRNYVLALPSGVISQQICQFVHGTKTLVTADTGSGRSQEDRATIARTMVGLGCNPNVASVIINSRSLGGAYPELTADILADQIAKTGKRVEVIGVNNEDTLEVISHGTQLAREMVYEASKLRRKSFDDQWLSVGVKCGASDTTSGIAGNPVIGYVYDKLVQAGGKAFFGETTEIVGAEHILAKRAINREVAKALNDAAQRVDDQAKSVGQDLRTINPVPSNIAGGLSTLEEKSLGAIYKSGSMPIQGVLKYSERPTKTGLYFVDNWMTMNSIFMGYAAAGAQLVIFQLGGGGIQNDSIFYTSGGVVAPLLWTTANPNTRDLAGWLLDFYSGTIIEGSETINEVGERLYKTILDIASGTMTKSETLTYTSATQCYTQEPVF